MDQTPPQTRKPKDLPFYKAPENVQTSSQIIKDAKDSLQRPQLRPLSTRRPETPQENQRKLFGEQSIRDPTNRPPSAFSLGSRHFDSDSRPVSGTRLSPLDHKPRVVDEGGPIAPKPPTDPNRLVRRTGSRQRIYQQQYSVDSQTDGAVDRLSRSKSGSLSDVSLASPTSSKPGTPESQRRVRSGPKERTKETEARNDPGTETGTPPRTDSGKRRRSKDRRDVENGYHGDSHRDQREGSGGSQRVSSAGKAGSAGRRDEETAEEAYLYNTKIGPIVDEMQTHIKEKDPERLSELGGQLYHALEDANLLGKNCKRRSVILKTVFKLLDLESPKLLLRLARLILALRVSGNNLVNVCKLVFKVSRDEKNDTFFLEGNTLELLIDTLRGPDIMGSSEALVYCVGALKFLSSNPTVVKHLVKRNCLEALSKLLIAVNKMKSDASRSTEQIGHILVQLTAAIRNLSEVGGTRPQIINLNIMEELCTVAELHQSDGDLMMNLARIFSKLTQHQDCCAALGRQSSHYRSFLNILHKFHKREDLVVRISYILGNLTLRSDESRQKLFDQPKALDSLLFVFKYYCQLDLKNPPTDGTDGKSSIKTEDVLIKVIRVIANLSIHEEIGPVLAGSRQCVDLLIQILDRKTLQGNEELVLNSMATINNLSYYNTSDSAIRYKQMKLAQCLLKYLDINHIEGLSEATRVLGNMSREKEIRDFLVKEKVDEFMVLLLDSGEREVVFTAVGVLINLMADDEKRSSLKMLGGVRKLIDVLRDFSREDWNLASMVCKTLWNYSGRITSTNSCFGEADGQELSDILDELLDEETALDSTLGDLWELYRQVWQNEFCPVANQLQRRIEANQSDFEPLDQPS